MSFNGSGTFNINTAGQPVVTGTVISSSVFNALTADLATGLSTCITKDGQTTVTANIPMNSFKFTGLAAGTAATDSVRLGQLQAGAATLITVTGTNTYAGTMTPALSAYAAGNTFSFLVPNTNTTSCTLNIDGLGAKSITRDGTTALVAGDLVANSEVVVVYDGTQFQVLNSNSKTNFNLSGTLTVAGNTTLSGGTANGVAYLNGSKVLTTGSALTFDGTNLGVGVTPAGSFRLEVGGSDGTNIALRSTGTTAAKFRAYVNGAESGVIGFLNGGGQFFEVAGSEQMRLTSTGLGIGTSSPGSKLQVNSTGVGVAKLVDTSATGYSGLTFAGTGTQNYAIGMGGPSEATFGVANKWFLYDGLAGAMRMAVDSSGNLGIGTSSPGYKLDVAGASGVAVNIANTSDSSRGGRIVVAGSAASGTVALNTTSSGYALTFGIDSTEKMRLDSSGNLLVGTTSISNLSTGAGVNVGFAVSGGQIRVQKNTDSNAYWSKASGYSSSVYHDFWVNGSNVGTISTSGTTTAYNTTSDQRLKENIADADSASDLIDAIKVRQFDWIGDGTHQRYGMIAQELVEVAPEAVHQPEDPERMMAVDYSKLVPMLIKEIQSLRQRVAQLEVK